MVEEGLQPTTSANNAVKVPDIADLTIELPNTVKILFCAPSNNAVDELIVRNLKDGIWNRRGRRCNQSELQIVRVGASSGDFDIEPENTGMPPQKGPRSGLSKFQKHWQMVHHLVMRKESHPHCIH